MSMKSSHVIRKCAAALLLGPFWLLQGTAIAQTASTDEAKARMVSAAAGPTPYPTNAKDWPGKGAIRVFGWMTENRKSFWTERERKQGSVVFVGDSLIGGWNSLGKDMPFAVANRGIGGDTTRGLLFRFNEDVLDLHPRAIVLLVGTNDLSAQQDPKQALSNIVEMLDLAQRTAPDVPIVLCTLPPRNHPQSPVDPRQVIEINKQLAALVRGRSKVAVFDLYTELVNPDGSQHIAYFASDQLHLSAAGYERFRGGLAPVLKQLNIG